MLTLVEVSNDAGDVLLLPLNNPEEGIVVSDIEGLDPVEATLVSSSFANMDGGQYHSSKRAVRNLKFNLELQPDYISNSIPTLRRKLYNYFMPKTQAGLKFVTEESGGVGLEVEITGRVESFSAPLFTKDPVSVISLLCYDPDFVDVNTSLISGDTTSTEDEILVTYDGTVETGIEFTLNVDRALDAFTIYHRAPDNTTRSLEFIGDLVEDDVVRINTIPGNKSVTLNHPILFHHTTESSVLYMVTPQSNWIELMPGDNYIRVYADGMPIPFEIEYRKRYGGL